jgi:hypothetical protein
LSKPSTPNTKQGNFLFADLIDQLNPKHPLLQLSKQIDWSVFEEEFSPLYSHLGKPSRGTGDIPAKCYTCLCSPALMSLPAGHWFSKTALFIG